MPKRQSLADVTELQRWRFAEAFIAQNGNAFRAYLAVFEAQQANPNSARARASNLLNHYRTIDAIKALVKDLQAKGKPIHSRTLKRLEMAEIRDKNQRKITINQHRPKGK